MSEVHQLRSTLRDLVAVSMMPATWLRRDPPEIAAGLADLLVTMLSADFVYIRLRDPKGDAFVDAARGDVGSQFPQWLDTHFEAIARDPIEEVIPDVGLDKGACRGLVTPICVDGDAGVVIAASDRRDFPNTRDRLLLSVTANQAAVAFQTARLIHERQDELQKAQTELAHVARMATLNELAASIAHETNQPLTAISANAAASLRVLTHADPDLELVREALHDIVAAGKRAADVMQRLRELSAHTEPQKTALLINDVVGEVVELVRSEVRRHQAALRLVLSSALPPVLADRVQLQQVIINLVINGLEAMDDVLGRPRHLVICTAPYGCDHVLISVQDSGTGVFPADIDKLFTAFFTTKSSGMGVGLSISRTIVESHGGRLWAVPNQADGATFHFTLPALSLVRDRKALRMPDAVWRKVLPRLNQSPTESGPKTQ